MTEKRVVLTGPVAARLAAATGAADHAKFDLSRILYSPSLGLFLATNSYSMLAVEPMPAVTANPWTPSPHKTVAKEIWIKAADMKRAADVCSDIGNNLDFVDNGELCGFWANNRFIACDTKPGERPMPPISMRFFPKESAPIAALFGARELVAIAETMAANAAVASDPAKPPQVTMAVHGDAWTKNVIEFSMPGPQNTTVRAVIMPMQASECGEYSLPYSGKPPAMNDAALRLLDWRSSPIDPPAATSPELELAIGLLMGMKLGGEHAAPPGLDADQLASARLLLSHSVAALKAVRAGG